MGHLLFPAQHVLNHGNALLLAFEVVLGGLLHGLRVVKITQHRLVLVLLSLLQIQLAPAGPHAQVANVYALLVVVLEGG